MSALYLSLTLCSVLGYIDRGGLLLTETAATVSRFVRRHLFERFEMFVKSVDAIILKRMEVFSLKNYGDLEKTTCVDFYFIIIKCFILCIKHKKKY